VRTVELCGIFTEFCGGNTREPESKQDSSKELPGIPALDAGGAGQLFLLLHEAARVNEFLRLYSSVLWRMNLNLSVAV
jgi:hypothetical protein